MKVNRNARTLFRFIFLLSVLLNILSLFMIYKKLLPTIDNLRSRLEKVEVSKEQVSVVDEDCEQKVYDVSLGQFVCKRKALSKSEVLSKCSSATIESMKKTIGNNVNIDDFEKARKSFMTICVESYGFEY